MKTFAPFSLLSWTVLYLLFHSCAAHAQIESSVSASEAEQLLENRIQHDDLLTPTGSSAYDIYQSYLAQFPDNKPEQRRLKRTLVAALAGTADQAMTEYFVEGGQFILKYQSPNVDSDLEVPLDQYYFKAAELMGQDHYLHEGLLSKAFFMEALRLWYLQDQDYESAKESLRKSLELDPSASYTYHEMGHLYFSASDYLSACQHFRQAIAWNSGWELAKENLRIAESALLQSKKK